MKCGGSNDYGQLGNGTATAANWISGAVTVTGISNAAKVYVTSSGYSTSYAHSCALLSDTTVKCWGQLPTYGNTNVPVAITGVTGVTDFMISPANNGNLGFWCAVLSGGTIKCAGTGTSGHLGNSASSDSNWISAAVTVTGIANASRIYVTNSGYSTDNGRSCALLSDTTVKCWGNLPNYATTNVPVAITGLTGVSDFSMSQGNSDPTLGHWCAVISGGTIKCSGAGDYGQL